MSLCRSSETTGPSVPSVLIDADYVVNETERLRAKSKEVQYRDFTLCHMIVTLKITIARIFGRRTNIFQSMLCSVYAAYTCPYIKNGDRTHLHVMWHPVVRMCLW